MNYYVIDANIVKGYYQEEILGNDSELFGSVIKLFEGLGNEGLAYLDDNNIIESEWKNVVDQQWFDQWLGTQLICGNINTIPVNAYAQLRKKLLKVGFPVTKRDLWYVKTAKSAAKEIDSNVMLVSEDCDFYDPKQKENKKRREVLIKKCKGSVVKILRKEGVHVCCSKKFE